MQRCTNLASGLSTEEASVARKILSGWYEAKAKSSAACTCAISSSKNYLFALWHETYHTRCRKHPTTLSNHGTRQLTGDLVATSHLVATSGEYDLVIFQFLLQIILNEGRARFRFLFIVAIDEWRTSQ